MKEDISTLVTNGEGHALPSSSIQDVPFYQAVVCECVHYIIIEVIKKEKVYLVFLSVKVDIL